MSVKELNTATRPTDQTSDRPNAKLGIVNRCRILEEENQRLKVEFASQQSLATADVQFHETQTRAVLHPTTNLGLPHASDYSATDLMRLCGISKATVLRVVTGRYYVGKAVRFRREDIDYYRKTGKRLEVTR